MSRSRWKRCLVAFEELENRLAPATHVWSGAVSGAWSNPSNWSVGGVPVNGEGGAIVLNFGSGAATFAMIDDIAGLNVDQMVFTSSGYSLTGGASPTTLNLTGAVSDAFSDSAGGNVISAANLTINLKGTSQFNVGANSSTIDAPITASGAFGLTKLGSGTLTLTGANTYSGSTSIGGGTLRLGNGAASGSVGAGSVNIVSPGQLAFARTDTYVLMNSITGSGGIRIDSGTVLLTANATLASTISLTVNAGGTCVVAAPTSAGRTLPNNVNLNGGTIRGGLDNSGSGGTITNVIGTNGTGFVRHTFTATGPSNLTIPETVSADVLLVGGGGGGGGSSTGGGGGGGGGQVRNLTAQSISSGSVVVGAGGTAGTTSAPGGAGGQSSINTPTSGLLTAIGGAGGNRYTSGQSNAGAGGVSGSGVAGGSGSPPFSFGGGGGGGGNAAVGGNGLGNVSPGAFNGGAGGAGSVGTLTGAFYGGGGGGGSWGSNTPLGGAGGGGTGGKINFFNSTAGTANTGGGGGGASGAPSSSGSAGGSGIAIVQYVYDVLTAAPLTLSGKVHVQAPSTMQGAVALTNEVDFDVSPPATNASTSDTTTLTYGGNLKVTNLGGTIAGGQTYRLFNFSGAWDGVSKFANDAAFNDVVSYSGTDLPALTGLKYHFEYATGVLSVLDVVPPTVTSVTPAIGPTSGGVMVVITGTLFTSVSEPADVKFGATNALSYVVNSATQITAVVPAGSGTVNVIVNNGSNSANDATDGTPGTTANDFTYQTLFVHSLVEGAAEGDDSVLVNASGAWTAAANVSWLHTTASGTNNGLASFHFDENTGPARTGTLTIAGETLTITQSASGNAAVATPVTLISSSAVIPPGSLSLDQPNSVAVDSAGDVYIADTNNNAIHKWTAATQTTATLISTGLTSPSGVAVDSLGNVYVADADGGGAIKKWTASTTSLSTLTSAASPAALAVDGVGNVYFSEPTAGRVVKWSVAAPLDPPATYVSGLALPTGVAVDANGTVYVADNGTGHVEIRESNSMTSSTLITGLSAPTGLDVDLSGNVYVADGTSIVKWTAATGTTASILSGLGFPNDVAVDAAGHVYYPNSLLNQVAMLPRAFEPALAPPTVTSVSAFIGPTTGGNVVVIVGTNFTGATQVTFKNHVLEAPAFTVNSATQITATVPSNAGTVELVDVSVTTSGGVSDTSGTADDYSYATPLVTSVVVNGAAFTTLMNATWTNGNPSVTVASTAALHVGDQVSSLGAGFPARATVVSVDSPTTFTVSANPTAAPGSPTTIRAVNAPKKSGVVRQLTNATWTSGATTVTHASTTTLVVGQYVSSTLPGLPADAVVASINGATSFELSSPATANQSAASIDVANAAIARDVHGSLVDLSGPGAGSVVQHLLVTFNQKVTLEPGAFAIVNLGSMVTSNSVAPATGDVAVVAAGIPGAGDDATGYTQYLLNFVAGAAADSFTNSATLGNSFTTLKNSLFRLDTVGSKVHAFGDTGANHSDTFWSLFGAANAGSIFVTGAPGGGDDQLKVDGIALSDAFTTFGSLANATMPPYNQRFDRDLDGDVDGIDLSQLYVTFGTIWDF